MGADYADTIAVDADDMRDDADAVFIRLARRSRRTLGASHDLPGSPSPSSTPPSSPSS